jgi:hypothetical protein
MTDEEFVDRWFVPICIAAFVVCAFVLGYVMHPGQRTYVPTEYDLYIQSLVDDMIKCEGEAIYVYSDQGSYIQCNGHDR